MYKENYTKPIPSAFAYKGPFSIIPSQNPNEGKCNYFDKSFQAPLSESKTGVAIRAHEYVHLQWDRLHTGLRKAITIFPEDVVDASLDAIVNSSLKEKDVDISHLPWEVLKEELPRRETILLAVRERALGKKDYYNRCSFEDKQGINRIFYYLNSPRESYIFQGIKALANLVLEDLEEKEEEEKKEKKLRKGISKTAKATVSDELRKLAIDTESLLGSTVNWGDMVVQGLKPPISIVNIKSYTRAITNGFIGGFSQPHRALLPAMDGQAWRRRKRVKGGSLLIDASGSMCLSITDIERCLDKNPALTCAMYSGYTTYGTLYILCQKGKKREKLPSKYPGGNVIDGPALEWLMKQPKPRVWVSDGGVTGINDCPCPTLTEEAKSLCRVGDITRVGKFSKAIEILRG